jgi:hypothetical protein
MINFVSKDEKRQQIISGIRRTVITVSSLVLLVYVVIMAGVLGWTLFWSAKETKSNGDIESLNTQIKNYSETEAVVRKLETRAKVVDDFLTGRGNASDAAAVIIDEGFPIIDWEYNLGGVQSVQVSATSPAQLKVYADYLEQYYNVVQPDEVAWTIKDGWMGNFLLSGRKKI